MHGLIPYLLTWHGRAWHGMALYCTLWHGIAFYHLHGMTWHGMAWHGMAWHGMAWHGRPEPNSECSGLAGEIGLIGGLRLDYCSKLQWEEEVGSLIGCSCCASAFRRETTQLARSPIWSNPTSKRRRRWSVLVAKLFGIY
jgi:hypothetical protein